MWPRMKLISRLLNYLCLSLNPDVLLGRGEDCSSQSFERTQPLVMGKARMLFGCGSKLVTSSLHSRSKEEDGLVARGSRMSPWRFTHSIGSSLLSGLCFLKVLQPPQTTPPTGKPAFPHTSLWGHFTSTGTLPRPSAGSSLGAADSSHWKIFIFGVFYLFTFALCWVRNTIQYLSHTIITS